MNTYIKKPTSLPAAIILSSIVGLVLVAVMFSFADSYYKSAIRTTEVNLARGESLTDFTVAKGGNWGIFNNKYSLVNPVVATKDATGYANISLHKTAFSGNWKLSVRAKGNSYADGAGFNIIFGYKSSEQYYVANFSEKNTALTNGIFSIEATGQKKVVSFADTIKANRHYNVNVERSGDIVKVLLNNMPVGQIYVGAIDETQLGFASNGGGADYLRIAITQTTQQAEQKPPIDTEAPTVPEPAPVVEAPTPSPTPEVGSTGTKIFVNTSDGLVRALANAQPGQTIKLADGVYKGKFVANVPGTINKPIVLTGSRAAVLDGGSYTSGYVLHLNNADYWRVDGITVRNGQKGIMADGVNNTLINNVEVSQIGHEAVHFRAFSTDNTIQNSYIHDTGKQKADYGEGVYIGTAQSNWKTYSGGKIDMSDRNSVINNRIERTSAENIDIKEGTTGGIVRDNVLDGAGMTGAYADSWIDLKGNEYLIESNKGTNAPVDGMQTHVILDGWGVRNIFSLNEMNVAVKGYGVRIQTSKGGASNIVRCNNKVTGAELGLANVACKR